MAGNLLQNGETISGTTPTGGYTKDQLVELVDMVCIINDAYAAGTTFVGITEGVWNITKVAAADGAFTQGDSVYLTTSGVINNTATGDQYVGKAWAAATTTATTVEVRINWGPGNTLV